MNKYSLSDCKFSSSNIYPVKTVKCIKQLIYNAGLFINNEYLINGTRDYYIEYCELNDHSINNDNYKKLIKIVNLIYVLNKMQQFN